MERVVTINLNGNPYQLDESAYEALRAYMDGAERTLANNPDKAEVLRDLEQAIADKVASTLSSHKSVVSLADMKRALEQMGPVEGDADSAQSEPGASAQDDSQRPLRRLYRIYDRHAWTGVSAGLAAYAGIDVAWIRIFWILATLFSGGFAAIFYVVMIFAVPIASTAEDLAAAHGAPFNAQEVIDRAKREYTRVAEQSAQGWRREQRAWRRQRREQGRSFYDEDAAPATPVNYVARVVAGFVAFIVSIITAAFLVAFLIALFSLLNTGAVFGWLPAIGIPVWLVIVLLCILYAAIWTPLNFVRRHAYATASGVRYRRSGGDDVIGVLAILTAIVVCYHFMPDFRDWVQMLPDTFAEMKVWMLER